MNHFEKDAFRKEVFFSPLSTHKKTLNGQKQMLPYFFIIIIHDNNINVVSSTIKITSYIKKYIRDIIQPPVSKPLWVKNF